MLNFKNIALRRKQTLIIMLTSTITLLLACVGFVGFEAFDFRGALSDEISTMAKIAGNNCTAALDFNDPKAAEDTLGALRAEPPIAIACVYNRQGKVFAVYQRDGKSTSAEFPPVQPPGQEFRDNQLRIFLPITVQGEKVGTIYVACDLYELGDRLKRSGLIAMFVLGISLLAAFLLSTRLQRVISGPVLALAQAVRTVTLEKNYTVRATKQSNDELGQLVEGFNEMLGQIEQRDAALQSARVGLEARVVERTTELAKSNLALNESQALYHSLVAQMPAGVFRKDRAGRYVFVNSWFCQLKDMKADEILGKTPRDLAVYEESTAKAGTPSEMLNSQRTLAIQGTDHHETIMRTGKPIKVEEVYPQPDGTVQNLQVVKSPVFAVDGTVIGTQGIIFDITELKQVQVELETIHKQLLDASRRSGMAEIATNVLHNVGNVLNSVNVSTGLIVESVKKSRVSSLARVVVLLREHAHDLGEFITNDARGKHVPAHLAQLSEHLLAEQEALVSELDSLRGNVEHIKEIVAMQQNYATFGGVKEMINVVNLVEDSLRMNTGALSRHRVEVIREFENVPPMNVEKHKIVQILVNLVRNAKYACDDSGRADKRLTVRVANGDGRVKISVIDNGVGIAPENLTRIFSHGFTTRKDGHGFGLHSGALAAKEMGGSLTVHSDGPGQGAAFTLELPCPPLENSHE